MNEDEQNKCFISYKTELIVLSSRYNNDHHHPSQVNVFSCRFQVTQPSTVVGVTYHSCSIIIFYEHQENLSHSTTSVTRCAGNNNPGLHHVKDWLRYLCIGWSIWLHYQWVRNVASGHTVRNNKYDHIKLIIQELDWFSIWYGMGSTASSSGVICTCLFDLVDQTSWTIPSPEIVSSTFSDHSKISPMSLWSQNTSSQNITNFGTISLSMWETGKNLDAFKRHT